MKQERSRPQGRQFHVPQPESKPHAPNTLNLRNQRWDSLPIPCCDSNQQCCSPKLECSDCVFIDTACSSLSAGALRYLFAVTKAVCTHK
mmetsp:Transcript_775/g.1251  ORF Transcript_775/g.1251 Transcript_775/m.1251 type:complete len:89 (+) Transcript_775:523-789(+)